jgi:hypothetical protein
MGAPSGLAAFGGGVHAYFGMEIGEGPLGIPPADSAPPVDPEMPPPPPGMLPPALPPAPPATLPPALVPVPLAPPPPFGAGELLFETPQARANASATASASKRAGQRLEDDIGRGW